MKLLLPDSFMEGECSWIKFKESDKVLQRLPVGVPVFVVSPAAQLDKLCMDIQRILWGKTSDDIHL